MQVIIRAWRDPSYRDQLPAEVRDALPDPPSDVGSLSDSELEQAAGAIVPLVGAAAAAFTAGGGAVTMADNHLDDPNGPG